MGYYYSVTAAGTADSRHGTYATIAAAKTAGKLDAKARGYTSGFYLAIFDGNEWNSKLVFEENTISDEVEKETVYYYHLVSMDEGNTNIYGGSESFSTAAKAKAAMKKTITLAKLRSYHYKIQMWSTGDAAVTVIEENEVLEKGWGKPPADPDQYYYRITTDVQIFIPVVSINYTDRAKMVAAAISQTLDYRYSLTRGKLELFKLPGGTAKTVLLDTYVWGYPVGKYPANWKLFDTLLAAQGEIFPDSSEIDWQTWAAIATVASVIIMVIILVMTRGKSGA